MLLMADFTNLATATLPQLPFTIPSGKDRMADLSENTQYYRLITYYIKAEKINPTPEKRALRNIFHKYILKEKVFSNFNRTTEARFKEIANSLTRL